jgi:hypothetical protein
MHQKVQLSFFFFFQILALESCTHFRHQEAPEFITVTLHEKSFCVLQFAELSSATAVQNHSVHDRTNHQAVTKMLLYKFV